MIIDMHFLVFFSVLISFIIAIVFSLQYFLIKSSYKIGFGYLALGSIFNLFGMIFVLIRDIPNLWIISIIGNNFSFILGALLTYIGIRKNYGQYSFKRWHYIYVSVFIGIIIYFTLVNNYLNVRMTINSVALGILHLIIVLELYKTRHEFTKITSLFLAFLFTFYTAFDFTRAIHYLIKEEVQIFSTSNMQITTYFIYIISNILSTFGFILNLNQRLNEENNETKNNLEIIFNTTPDAVAVTTLENGTFIAANEGFSSETGYKSSELIGSSILELGIWKNNEDREKFIKNILDNGFIENMEMEFRRKNATTLTGLMSAKVIKLSGKPHIVSITRNISYRKVIENKLKENENFLAGVIENNGAIIYVKDYEGRYKLVNKKWEEVTGFKREEIIGKKDVELFKNGLGEEFHTTDLLVMNSGNVEEREEELINESGRRYFLSIKFPIKNGDNNIIGVCGLSTDITERKRHEVEIKEMAEQLEIERNYAQAEAITDGLTGLYNRRYFDNILRKEFYRLKRTGEPLSLIMIDIDYFKNYNDTYGHLEGDNCLKLVSTSIRKKVTRTTDIVARYGGEEFVVVLPMTNETGALKIAENIRQEVENLNLPNSSSKISDVLTISLGVTTALRMIAESPNQIIHLADDALYKAKENGRNRVEKSVLKYIKDSDKLNFSELIWNKSDESGNEKVDSQHKSLINGANKLINAINLKLGKEKYLSIVEELLKEIAIHFEDEEDIVKNTKFPYLDNHKLSHINLVEKAKRIVEKVENDEMNPDEIIAYLTYDVVAQHMEIEDKLYFPYLVD